MDISRLNELFFEHNYLASMNIEMMDFKVTVRPTHLPDPDAKGYKWCPPNLDYPRSGRHPQPML